MAEIGILYSLSTVNGTINFNPSVGWGYVLSDVSGLDAPSLRMTLEPVPQRDGEIVYSTFKGGRHISMQGYIRFTGDNLTDRRSLEDDLRSVLDGAVKDDAVLTFTPSGTSSRQVTVRMEAPLQIQSSGFIKQFMISLVAGDPVIYGGDQNSYSTTTLASTATGGSFTFPFAFPVGFGSYNDPGLATIINGGNAEVYPVVRIYGQITNPEIFNEDKNEAILLTGTVSAGDFWELDFKNETIYLNGDRTLPLIGKLDIPNSRFFTLSAGTNAIRFTGTSPDSVAYGQVIWRNGFA